MISNLPKWYRIASIGTIGEETFKKRSTAIETIVKANDLPFLLDCIRCYLNKPIKSRKFNDKFFNAFNAMDGMYLEDTSNLEKRILAGAIIYEVINKQSKNSLTVATVLKSAIFGTEPASIVNIDIVQGAINYLEDQSTIVRETPDFIPISQKYPILPADPQTIETLSTHIKSLAAYIKGISTNLEKQNAAFIDRLAVVEEEANIHWWLFRSFSSYENMPVYQLKPIEAPFILALELGDLYKELPIPQNAEAFLNKILSDVPEKIDSISIKEATDIITSKLRDEVQENVIETYGNLTPLTFAALKAIESGGNSAWVPLFENQTGLLSAFRCSPVEMSLQFLTEVLLYTLKSQ